MNNIFENAYFGKVYKTRDGRKAIYLGYSNNSIYHACFIENESNKTFYFNNGDAWGHQRKGNNIDDIVSEWQEPIDEEELDKLAKEYMTEERRCIIKGACDLSFYDLETAFKAGYRKVKEL